MDAEILLVGGGVASARCARTLRRLGFDGSILLVGAEPTPPYNRPPLSKELLRDDLPTELLLAEPESFYERRRIELLTSVEVVELDAAGRRATLSSGDAVRFERCLLATGARPRPLSLPGAEGVHLLRTVEDARRLREAAVGDASQGRAAVIGGGFIGVEVASALADLGRDVVLVELGEALWGGALGAEMGRWAEGRLRAAGVDLRLRAAVTAVHEKAVWIGDDRVEAGLVVAGIGVSPRVELAAGAGLRVDDGILTDAGQRTSHEAVWAAGDVARTAGARVEHWHAARESGERAARSMLGLEVPPVPTPWVFTEVAGTAVDVIGAARGWEEERWIGEGAALACLRDGRIVQLAVIGGAVAADEARELVAAGADFGELVGRIGP